MIVISDTTPIISLTKINQLELLEKLFKTVKIPVAVYAELTTNPIFHQEAKLINSKTFIETVSVIDTKSVTLLQKATGLDKGESEAIILAEESSANLILMDERKGRQVATQLGNKITGTFGIILTAHAEKLITSEKASENIKQLRNIGIRISDTLYDNLIEKIAATKI